ncbi:MAG TPA: alpha/beta fold hydrolase [Gammaproteobacteria bacterium]|nr:alpha/beta fold hydrolase [Gammaproteobacteria bacterium]
MLYPETQFLLSASTGNVELIATKNKTAIATAIICHPHPLFGGTMNNKVVTTLARAFQNLNINTIRFNFRGVGKSEGKFDQGVGETDDVIAIARWAKTHYLSDKLYLAGFSFGSYVAARAATQLPVTHLLSIAPPVINFDFTALPPITCPWLIIQGEQDEIVSPEAVFDWVETLNPKPTLIRMPKATHFFHGQLMALREMIEKNLR